MDSSAGIKDLGIPSLALMDLSTSIGDPNNGTEVVGPALMDLGWGAGDRVLDARIEEPMLGSHAQA